MEGYIIKFKTGYLKAMGLKRQDIIEDFFKHLLFNLLMVSMPFIF